MSPGSVPSRYAEQPSSPMASHSQGNVGPPNIDSTTQTSFIRALHRALPSAETQLRPFVDKRSDVMRIHRAIPEQMVVIPDTAANQTLMVFEALIPASGVLLANDGDLNNEIDKLEGNCHFSYLQREYTGGQPLKSGAETLSSARRERTASENRPPFPIHHPWHASSSQSGDRAIEIRCNRSTMDVTTRNNHRRNPQYPSSTWSAVNSSPQYNLSRENGPISRSARR